MILQQHKAAQLKVYHSVAQPQPQEATVCQSLAPQCSHVCVVVRDQSPVCLCPRNSTRVDGHTCRLRGNYSEIEDPVANQSIEEEKEEEEVSERFMSTLIIIITASSLGILIILLTLLVSLPIFLCLSKYSLFILLDPFIFEKKEIRSR